MINHKSMTQKDVEINIGMYGISRVDRFLKDRNTQEHYWYVRIWGQGKKPKIQKTFSDTTYGSKTFSFAAAVAFRDKHVDRISAVLSMPYLENIAQELHQANKIGKQAWQKERIERRKKAIEKFGNNLIYVGYGIEAAKKAREYGASKVTCWKIKSGHQNYYKVYSYIPKEIGEMCKPMIWTDRPTGTLADIDKQREFGKTRTVIGIGLEAANKAKSMGMSARVCNRILRGQQNFIKTCATLPKFEVNGFPREITPEISGKIISICSTYVKNKSEALEIAAEVMLNFSSGTEVISCVDGFLRSLCFKYISISKKHKPDRNKRLDINGDIACYDQSTGRPMKGIGIKL